MKTERAEYRYGNDIGYNIESALWGIARALSVDTEGKIKRIPKSKKTIDELTLQGLMLIFTENLHLTLGEVEFADDWRALGMGDKGDRRIVIEKNLDIRGKSYLILRLLGHIAIGKLSSTDVVMTPVVIPSRNPIKIKHEFGFSIAEAKRADKWVEDLAQRLPFSGTLTKGVQRSIDWYKKESK